MVAGLIHRFSIWRISEVAGDDEVGGAIITGTPLYLNVAGRIEAEQPTQLLLEQGIEYNKLWNVDLRPRDIDVRERDELELTGPTTHEFCGERFRILSIERPSMHPSDSRNFLKMVVRHVDFARSLQ